MTRQRESDTNADAGGNPAAGMSAGTPAVVLPPTILRALDQYAPHVRSAMLAAMSPSRRKGRAPTGRAGAFVAYENQKSPAAASPPAMHPVYRLRFDARGRGCTLEDLKTGRVTRANDLFAGFVRMRQGGDIYVSPRSHVSAPGDGHPAIAASTPEWMDGHRSIVAGGEVGILGGAIVGHNDKTGHYITRKNREQSGMPADKFYPFTVDARRWYRK